MNDEALERQEDAFAAGMGGAEEGESCPFETDSPAGDDTAPAGGETAPGGEEPEALGALTAGQEDDLDAFARLFPQAAEHPDAIPEQVWQAVRGGASLSLAYALHQLDESRSAARAAENAARSTGSMCSAGADRKPKDPFLEGWDD